MPPPRASTTPTRCSTSATSWTPRPHQLDITYLTDFEAEYEAVDRSYDDVTDDLQQHIDTADIVLAAVAAEAKDDGFFESIGLWGTDLPRQTSSWPRRGVRGGRAPGSPCRRRRRSPPPSPDAGSVGTKRFLWAVGALRAARAADRARVVLVRRRRRRAATRPHVEPDCRSSQAALTRPSSMKMHSPGAGERSIDDDCW